MKPFRSRLRAIIAAFALVLGLLVSAGAAPCAASDGQSCGGMTCDYCLSGALPGVSACGGAGQVAPSGDHPGPAPVSLAGFAWFGTPAQRLAGIDLPPDLPPPR